MKIGHDYETITANLVSAQVIGDTCAKLNEMGQAGYQFKKTVLRGRRKPKFVLHRQYMESAETQYYTESKCLYSLIFVREPMADDHGHDLDSVLNGMGSRGWELKDIIEREHGQICLFQRYGTVETPPKIEITTSYGSEESTTSVDVSEVLSEAVNPPNDVDSPVLGD